MKNPNPQRAFDIVIIGGGLAGLTRADLISEKADPALRVAIVDPLPDSLQAKTFSSWRRRSDPPHRYSSLVTRSWSRFRVIAPDGQRIERSFGDYIYETIPGDRLLAQLSGRIDADPRFTRIRARAIEVSADPATQGQIRIQVRLDDGQTLTASHVLSSPARHPGAIGQYFMGWVIEVPQNFSNDSSLEQIDPDRVELMDFRLPQGDGVCFIYTLPFSNRTALVEFTTFSTRRPDEAECRAILEEHLAVRAGLKSYSILSVESGEIPMGVECEPLFPPLFQGAELESIGAALSRIKPSTGYSFQRNLEAGNRDRLARLGFRFRIYDSVLLGLIRSRSSIVAAALSRMFAKNPPERVLAFLDERSRLIDELKIFGSLPWIPFATQLVALHPFILSVAATLLLGPSAGWSVPIAGLLSAGIGHGSLDHLLANRGPDRAQLFYLRYLGLIALFLGAAWLFPALALAWFVIQSADHFGESYWIRALRHARGDWRVRLLAWVWGLFAALFTVFFHWSEALPIMTSLLGGSPALGAISVSNAQAAAMVLFGGAIASAVILGRYEERASGRAPSGVPATLLLAGSQMALPLLQGFLCFFAYWHGWDTVRETRIRQGWSAREYLKRAAPFTLVAIAALAAGSSLWVSSGQAGGWPALFVLLGALTAAHAPVMKRFLLGRPAADG